MEIRSFTLFLGKPYLRRTIAHARRCWGFFRSTEGYSVTQQGQILLSIVVARYWYPHGDISRLLLGLQAIDNTLCLVLFTLIGLGCLCLDAFAQI
jgi:hypothetical protein